MNATAVASSSQMFSPFGQATQGTSTPPVNPFAPSSNVTPPTNNPFGFGGATIGNAGFGSTAKRENPFADTTGDNTKPSVFGGFGAKPVNDNTSLTKPTGFVNENRVNNPIQAKSKQQAGSKIPRSVGSTIHNGSQPPATAASSADADSDSEPDDTNLYNKNDPHAVKVYKQIRKDGLSPPSWPSRPGDPNNKAQMAKFREQYEEYRSKVRASLTRAGLIDDPTKRRALQDAIDFRGICQDMCPEYEKIQRITEFDVPYPEKDPKTTFPSKKRMVKKLARSAAGQEAPLPMDVLSIPTLRKTLDYLIDDLLQTDENLPTLHGYLWDRTRAIRRDFSFFSSLNAEDIKTQASVLETIARFHVTSLHLLCREGKTPEDFVEQQELEQLGKALLSLRDIYDDCNSQGIVCENEAEFRAYYIVFHANDPNIMEVMQRQWRRSLWIDSEEVQTAASLVEALQSTQDFHGPLTAGPSLAASGAHQTFFRIVEDRRVSYTMACFAECHFPQLRRSILANIKKALTRPKESSHDVTAETLNKFLRFDTVQEAIDFAELHNLEFGPSPNLGQRLLLLNNRRPLPHHRLKHQFSQSLVERKRGSKTLPDILHTTFFEDKSASNQDQRRYSAAEDGLFVDSKEENASPTPGITITAQPVSRESPFASASCTTFATTTTATTTPSPFSTNTPSLLASTPFSSSSAPTATTTTTATTGFPKPATNAANPFAPSPNPISTTPPIFGSSTPPSQSPFQGFSNQKLGQDDTIKSIGPPPAANTTTDSAANSIKSPAFGVNTTSTAAPSPFSSPFQPSPSSSITITTLGGQGLGTITKPPVEAVAKKDTAPALSFTPTSSPIAAANIPASQKLLPSITPGASGTKLQAPQLNFTAPKQINKAAEQPKSGSLQQNAGLETKTPAFNLNKGSSLKPIPAATPPSEKLSPFTPPTVKKAPPAPPRDLMGDFARWFALGDDGLLDDFQTYFIEDLLKTVYLDWEQAEAEKKIQQEEARDREIADNFRRRTLSVTYFYRWKTKAREKRLQHLRRSGRDQLRQFYKRQHPPIPRSEQESVKRVASEHSQSTRLERQEQLLEGFKQTRRGRHPSATVRSSSVMTNMANDRDAIAESVTRHFRLPMSVAATPAARSRSSSISKGGSKTRALREALLGGEQSHFRRSLGSVASSERSSPDNASRVSNVSERWRLKAMGIVQLPDGSAVPESLLHSSRGSTSGYLRRTPSITSMTSPRNSFGASGRSYVVPSIEHTIPGYSMTDAAGAASNKRKRMTNDSILMDQDETSGANTHKRVLSDAENLIQELRAMREEMEEGTMWFKEQNGRLHTALSSRGTSPI